MYNIDQLSKQLTHDEYEVARELYNLLRERGNPAAKAAAIVYRAGRLAGKKERQEKYAKQFSRMREVIAVLKSGPPEARVDTGRDSLTDEAGVAQYGPCPVSTEEEGSESNE